MSENEKTWKFFEELELQTGPAEKKIFIERNKSIHGNLSEINYDEFQAAYLSFKTTLNRIILRILNYEGKYIDYSWANGSELIYTAKDIHMRMHG